MFSRLAERPQPNGATPLRAWKTRLAAAEAREKAELQWGHALAGVEDVQGEEIDPRAIAFNRTRAGIEPAIGAADATRGPARRPPPRLRLDTTPRTGGAWPRGRRAGPPDGHLEEMDHPGGVAERVVIDPGPRGPRRRGSPSRGVATPYHFTISPCSSRSGNAWVRNRRYVPSASLRRCSWR